MHKTFTQEQKIMKEINEKGIISDDLKASIKEEMDKCSNEFNKIYGDN